jgi:hypothetical protein
VTITDGGLSVLAGGATIGGVLTASNGMRVSFKNNCFVVI